MIIIRRTVVASKHSAGAIAKNTKDLQVKGRVRELETGPWHGLLKLESPPYFLVTHFRQQGHAYSNKVTSVCLSQIVVLTGPKHSNI